jgi:hypothetical protein
LTTENLLSKIFESHTGKYSDKWNSYLDIYWDLFSPICHNDSDILEIGIQNGGSLEIWAKLFPNAKNLIGFDVHTKCTELKFSDPRIKVFVEDAADEKSGSLVQKTTSNLGVVIDDGSHVSQDIIRSFLIFFPQLKPGGIFVIEDLHASYWSDWQGGISHPESSMQFLKLLADIVNFDHWGIKDKRTDIFELIPATYGQLEESTLASIESITFFDSVCVVRKKSHTNQGLGLRIGSGSEAIVYPEAKDSVGAASLAPNQELNPFGISKDLSLGQLQIYKTQHQELQTQHQELQTQNSQLSESIRAIQATLSWKVTKPLRYIKSKLSRGG